MGRGHFKDLPVVVCFDVEPDRRVPDRRPVPWRGFEALVERLPGLRRRIAETVGTEPAFTFALRMDPQIGEIHADTAWVAHHHRAELEALAADGHDFGVHPHAARWVDGRWIADHADESWVQHCVATSLEAFERAFDRRCLVTRLGDRFLSRSVVQQLDGAGVTVDLSLEPLLPAVRSLAAHEVTTGWLPDTARAPTIAYRPSDDDPFRRDRRRTEGLVLLPLTPGVTIVAAGDDQVTGAAETLVPWMEPRRFARLLRRRLDAPAVTHLAFAVRSDTARSEGLWAAVEANLAAVAEATGSPAWLGATDAVALALEQETSTSHASGDPHRWALGSTDPGWREGAPPVVDPEPAPIEWCSEPRSVTCPACGFDGDGELVGRTHPTERVGLDLVRCPHCSSVVVDGALDPSSTDEALGVTNPALDGYIEYHASLESIAVLVDTAQLRPGARVLDIGCGYGFALDLASALHQATGIGVDPSPAAVRGRDELGLDLRQTTFDADADLGERFDAVIASEVIEHVAAPVEFLGSVRRHLADDGVLVLSTPDADVVRAGASPTAAVAAIGTVHPFLLSADALEAMLTASRFGTVQVHRYGSTLVAVAHAGRIDRRGGASAGVDLRALARYCADRRDAAVPGSALHAGMAARAARFALNLGDLPTADAAQLAARGALVARHGWDVGDPGDRRRSGSESPVRPVLADAHHTAGMLDLLLHDRPRRAGDHFEVAAQVAERCSEVSRDPSLPALRRSALGHAALARARHDPPLVASAVDALLSVDERDDEAGRLAAQTFTELVARGQYPAAEQVAARLPELDEQLEGWSAPSADEHLRRAALDASFSLAMLDLQRGRSTEAEARFSACAARAARHDDEHSRSMAVTAADHARLAREQGHRADRAVEPA